MKFKRGIHPLTEFKKGQIPWNKGKKGVQKPYWLGKKRPDIGKMISKRDKGKKLSLEHKKRISEGNIGKHIGEKCHFWKGGITPLNKKIRMSTQYNLWRKSVFERDNFTCQKYGIMGGRLQAHHINNFAEEEDLRFAIDNGITLSDKAHREFHKKYGCKNNTKEQLIEFLL